MCDKSVAKGGSATTGFLTYAAKGPMKDFYNGLAGNQLVDTLFMSGLLLIGLALVTGVGVQVATVSGIAMLLMMWSAVLPGENNPVLDDHIVYAVILIGVMMTNKNQVWGLGSWWQKQDLVKKYPVLA
jgi:thiosulfate dehydrogenase [quinone] large subunit